MDIFGKKALSLFARMELIFWRDPSSSSTVPSTQTFSFTVFKLISSIKLTHTLMHFKVCIFSVQLARNTIQKIPTALIYWFRVLRTLSRSAWHLSTITTAASQFGHVGGAAGELGVATGAPPLGPAAVGVTVHSISDELRLLFRFLRFFTLR